MNIPINDLSGAAVDNLRLFQRVVVMGMGSANPNDNKSLQACVRLTKVYRLTGVIHCPDAVQLIN